MTKSEYPLVRSVEQVRKILSGECTRLTKVVNPQPGAGPQARRLWVQEDFAYSASGNVLYMADCEDDCVVNNASKMERNQSRILLDIVRVVAELDDNGVWVQIIEFEASVRGRKI